MTLSVKTAKNISTKNSDAYFTSCINTDETVKGLAFTKLWSLYNPIKPVVSLVPKNADDEFENEDSLSDEDFEEDEEDFGEDEEFDEDDEFDEGDLDDDEFEDDFGDNMEDEDVSYFIDDETIEDDQSDDEYFYGEYDE